MELQNFFPCENVNDEDRLVYQIIFYVLQRNN